VFLVVPDLLSLTRFGRAASRCSITSSAWARIDWGTHEAERLGGLEIDHQLDFHRLLNRQVGRLVTLKNLAAIDAGLRATRTLRAKLANILRGCGWRERLPALILE
jgi:hypothetical protein